VIERGAIAVALIACAALASGPESRVQSAEFKNPHSGLSTLHPGLQDLGADLDAVFDSDVFARALVGVRVDSLRTGETLYRKNADKLVVPASNQKLLTLAVAADRLGWDYRFETRLEAAGPIAGGVLTGDLVVTGNGDPSLTSPDLGHPELFLEWAAALRDAGVRRVDGRLIGDDRAFDDRGLGAGWSWDYLSDSYAAPSSALSYNENVATIRIVPGRAEGDPATIAVGPVGSGLEIENRVRTGPAGSTTSVTLARMPGSARLVVDGRVPTGGAAVSRVTTVDNPTRFFVEALRLALVDRGIAVTGGAWNIDDVTPSVAAGTRRLIARRESAPLSSLGAQMLKISQNFYAEMLLKAIGRKDTTPGSAAAGRHVVRDTLARWGIASDAIVMNDGSGLSRYDYVTSDAIVTLLTHVWQDERLRGPFVAALPVGGHDGTLQNRMRTPDLDRRVQAKTGTISNVRALSGYLETQSGEKLVFSIIANNFTAPTSDVDALVEKALARLVSK
jgi:D-alanyl-D-alanine carboxypeptidase/D-alanyl-D-alanine-endopeptidase (penicillin-binding protein 4)